MAANLSRIIFDCTGCKSKFCTSSSTLFEVVDMFVAGTDTSANTMEWDMAEIIKNPNIMRKVKEELANVVEKGKTIEESDIAKLPYLQCVVKETFRLHPLAPLLIPRKVGKDDIQVDGFAIQKGSQVMVNIWTIGRDPSIWESPLEFKPKRFWNSDIDYRGQNFELIPCGAGRRICPGLSLGVKMVHLMLGSLLNSFKWRLEVVWMVKEAEVSINMTMLHLLKIRAHYILSYKRRDGNHEVFSRTYTSKCD